jgi:hypothetical protein
MKQKNPHKNLAQLSDQSGRDEKEQCREQKEFLIRNQSDFASPPLKSFLSKKEQ